jgi:valyl-tRNA synthetase
MPFVTEELWSHLRPEHESIMVAEWPEKAGRADAEAEQALERFQELVTSLRRLRADHGIDPGARMNVAIAAGSYRTEIDDLSRALVVLARLGDIELKDRLEAQPHEARAITPSGIEAAVALGEVIDLDVETERLRKKLIEVEQDIERAQRKLDNQEFTSKAPPAIVEKERRKLDDAQANRDKIEAQLRSVAR